MAPLVSLLSPAELDFLSRSLAQSPPIRPDLRTPTQFRPLVAETGILPSTNGSARVCFSDGTEAVTGIKAELGRSSPPEQSSLTSSSPNRMDMSDSMEAGKSSSHGKGFDKWLEVSIEIPGFRDDDPFPIFLAAMLTETLLADGTMRDKLWINERWHWKLYIDILSLSPPLSYPLPLLSLTIHLALLHTALPSLVSEPEDDPLFDDDWAAAKPLFPKDKTDLYVDRPPITLLVMTVGENIIFDPTKEELAVAENVVAASVVLRRFPSAGASSTTLDLTSIRLIDPPSRLTPPGSSDPTDSAAIAGNHILGSVSVEAIVPEETRARVWCPPHGGLKRSLLAKVVRTVLQPGGVSYEVLEGLTAVQV